MIRTYYMFFSDAVPPRAWEDDIRRMNEEKMYEKPDAFEHIFRSVILYFPNWEAAKDCLIHNRHRFYYLLDVKLDKKKIWIERMFIV